jgi:hypothetical protein
VEEDNAELFKMENNSALLRKKGINEFGRMEPGDRALISFA